MLYYRPADRDELHNYLDQYLLEFFYVVPKFIVNGQVQFNTMLHFDDTNSFRFDLQFQVVHENDNDNNFNAASTT